MFSNLIDAPYISLPIGNATPALILCLIYFFVLFGFYLYGEITNTLHFHRIHYTLCSRGRTNSIWMSSITYVILAIACIPASSFLTADNLLLKISKTYLQYEPLIFLGVFLFLCSACINTGNKDRHIIAANRILRYIIPISVFTGLLDGQLDFSLWQNKLVILGSVVLHHLLMIIEIKTNSPNENLSDKPFFLSHSPINDVDLLFPKHRAQAEQIANIICNSSSEPFSICLSGKWGVGKTSVMNGVIKLLEEKSNNTYDFIQINALELDNKQTMFNYLMTQMKDCLWNRGVYVGVDSEYRDFLASAAGTITTGAIGAFLQKIVTRGEKDYRTQKKKLERVLERAYPSGKLIVIIDDIERCNRTLAREALFLIKEIATMKNCVSVFVTDYDMLNQLVDAETEPESKETHGPSNSFLDKFFNFRITLHEETPASMLSYYDHCIPKDNAAFQSIYQLVGMSPSTWYQNVINYLESRITPLQTDVKQFCQDCDESNLLHRLKGCHAIFVERMQIPRNIVRFYNSLFENTLRCHRDLFPPNLDSEELSKVQKYIRDRNLGQVLLLLSFIEVCLPSQSEQLKEAGTAYIDFPLYGQATEVSIEKQLILELTNGMLFGEKNDYKKVSNYIKQEIFRFVDAFFNPSFNLSHIINNFTSQEEEWITAIDTENTIEIELHWKEMMTMVLQKNPYKDQGVDNTWRIKKFSFLLRFAERQVATGTWNTDLVYSIFSNTTRNFDFFTIGTGLMQSFWEILGNSRVFTRPSKKICDDVYAFSTRYTYKRIGSLYRLAHYLIPHQDDYRIEKLQEILLNSTQSLGENIFIFEKRLTACIPNLPFLHADWYENAKEITSHIYNCLIDYELLKYPDMHEEVEQMMDSVEELHCFESFLDWCKTDSQVQPSFALTDLSSQNMDLTIQYIEEVIMKSQDFQYGTTEKIFSDFFQNLSQSNISLTPTQVARLHNLVSLYVTQTANSSHPYRRVLVELTQKATYARN